MMRSMAFVIVGLVFVACKSASAPTSQTSHDLGRVTNDDAQFQWAKLTDPDQIALEVAVAMMETGGGEPNVKASERAQFWADRVLGVIRSSAGGADVPAMRVHVLETPAVQGAALVVTACLPYEFSWEKPAAADGRSEDGIAVFERRLGALHGEGEPDSCYDPGLSPDKVRELLAWLTKPWGECRFSFNGKSILASEGCRPLVSSRISRAKRFGYLLMADQMVLTTGLLKAYTHEDELVATIAHELAHYAMAHATTPNARYGYFYRLGDRNPGEKPRAVPELADLGRRAIEASETLSMMPTLVSVEGQRFHSALFPVVGVLSSAIAGEDCQGAECRGPCQDLSKHLSDAATKSAIGRRFPREELTAGGLVAYKRYEDLLEACLARDLMLGSKENPTRLGSLFFNALMWLPSEMSVEFRSVVFPNDLRGAVADLNRRIPETLRQTLEPAEAIMSETVREGLGYYTQEQEADDLATEWLARSGLDPGMVGQAFLSMLKMIEANDSGGETIGLAACQALMARGFRDEGGKPVRVTIGDFADMHHHKCFRAFNVRREIETHGLRAESNVSVSRPSPDWANFVAGLE